MYGLEEFVKTLLLVLLGFVIVWLAVTLVEYVLKGLALYRMARNAGYPSPGLAWVPVANSWLLGSLCDRSHYALAGKQWHFAVILPVLDVLGLVGGGLFAGLYGIFTNVLYYGSDYDEAIEGGISSVGGNLLGLACTVVTALALYQLYKDYAPGREVLYTVLSVILGGLAQGILLMTLRNRVPLSAAGAAPWGGWGQPGNPPPPPGYGPGYGGPGTTGWAQPPYQNGPAQGGPGTTGWAQPPYQGGPAQGGPGATGWAQPPYQNGPAQGGPEQAPPPDQTASPAESYTPPFRWNDPKGGDP